MKDNYIILNNIAKELRVSIIEHSYRTKTPHLGSCLSCIDILVTLYFDIMKIDPIDPKNTLRDRFILSKGHAAPALFQVLALKGFFSKQRLINSSHNGKDFFGEHLPAPSHLPGVEAATGSLGHGLSIGIGMLLAAKIQQLKFKVFVLLGDGECNEGTIWEAALFAAKQELENLVVIIDFNKWQATGRSQNIMQLDPLREKWEAFGWDSYEVNGHDIKSMADVLKEISNNSHKKPTALIAHTIKGKGVSFMENDNNWHYCIPSEENVIMAKKELEIIHA